MPTVETFLPAATILALFPFAFVMALTPGPNNIMLATSGVNFGIARTFPHMGGIMTGFVSLLLAVGFGLGAVFQTFPVLRLAIKFGGIAYIIFLAWKTATAGSLGGGTADAPHPFRYVPAILFQFVNPKAWVMAISVMAIYVRPDHVLADVPTVAIIFGLANIPCMFIWTGFGAALREFLKRRSRIRIFNMAMGGLLVASVLPMLET